MENKKEEYRWDLGRKIMWFLVGFFVLFILFAFIGGKRILEQEKQAKIEEMKEKQEKQAEIQRAKEARQKQEQADSPSFEEKFVKDLENHVKSLTDEELISYYVEVRGHIKEDIAMNFAALLYYDRVEEKVTLNELERRKIKPNDINIRKVEKKQIEQIKKKQAEQAEQRKKDIKWWTDYFNSH